MSVATLTVLAALVRVSKVRKDLGKLTAKADKSLAETMFILSQVLTENLKSEAGITPPLEDGLSELEAALMRSHQKIQSIKAYRERTNAGLMEAKLAVEAWANRNGVAEGSNFKRGSFVRLPQKFVDKGYLLGTDSTVIRSNW